MLSKANIKWIRSLKIKKYREQSRFFIVEGEKNVLEFLSAGHIPREIILHQDQQTPHLPPHLPVTRCSPTSYAEISTMDTPPGILAIFPYLPSHELDLSAPLLLLDSIKDPGNMGTILRSADWFGYTQVICSPDCVDIYNPKTVASSMGSLARMHVQHSPLATFIDQHPSYHYYALTLTGEDYQHIPYQHPIALITGSESHGISDTLLHKNLTQIRIPSKGSKTESLNAAIATAIALAQVSQHS